MASSMAKNMEAKLYAMINCLADNYGFDTDEAFEFVRSETDVDHIGEIFKMIGVEETPKKVETEKKVEETEKKVETDKKVDTKETEKKVDAETASVAPTESSAGGDIAEKVATCKKNISLWEKKLADGKAKDADKQREKITKEKAKLAKLEAKMPKEEVVKVETKKAEKDVSDDKKEKRIKRFSPVMASQLKKALEDVGLEMSDKLKKVFQQYVEDLTDDDFRATGLADHMRAFAKREAPMKSPELKEDTEVEELVKEMDSLLIDETPKSSSNAVGGGPCVVELSLKDLQAISMTATLDENTGTFWDADNGRFVKGPDSIPDEDATDVKFNGKTYSVGDKTGRVYLVENPDDEDSKITFAGFAGVGKFKGLSIA